MCRGASQVEMQTKRLKEVHLSTQGEEAAEDIATGLQQMACHWWWCSHAFQLVALPLFIGKGRLMQCKCTNSSTTWTLLLHLHHANLTATQPLPISLSRSSINRTNQKSGEQQHLTMLVTGPLDSTELDSKVYEQAPSADSSPLSAVLWLGLVFFFFVIASCYCFTGSL